MKAIYPVILLASLLLLTGCEYPQASVTKAEWIGFSREKNEISSQLFMEVKNPNFFSLPIQGIKYQFELLGKPLLSGEVGLEKNIPANGSAEFTVPLNVSLRDSMTLGVELLSHKEWPWKVRGNVIVDAPVIGKIEVPYSKTGTWQRPTLLNSGIEESIGKGVDLLKGIFSK